MRARRRSAAIARFSRSVSPPPPFRVGVLSCAITAALAGDAALSAAIAGSEDCGGAAACTAEEPPGGLSTGTDPSSRPEAEPSDPAPGPPNVGGCFWAASAASDALPCPGSWREPSVADGSLRTTIASAADAALPRTYPAPPAAPDADALTAASEASAGIPAEADALDDPPCAETAPHPTSSAGLAAATLSGLAGFLALFSAASFPPAGGGETPGGASTTGALMAAA